MEECNEQSRFNEADIKYFIQFSHAELTIAQVTGLLEEFGDAGTVWKAADDDIRNAGRMTPEAAERLIGVRKEFDPEAEQERIFNTGIRYVSYLSDDYPERLKNISDRPVGLFYIGHLPDSSNAAIAMVGSRDCTNYGKETAISIAKRLALSGIDVVSGMAAGIDGYSHRGALNGVGETYAVLGCGADICYPRVNCDIYARIPEKGGIISEYYPGAQPLPYYFPKRNRLISGLADGVLVVEARERSGSWITVDQGLEQGKDIYAVPGRICDRLSLGCNNLIRSGARIVTRAEDIITDLAPRYLRNHSCVPIRPEHDRSVSTGRNDDEDPRDLSDREQALYKRLDINGTGIDEICSDGEFSVPEALRLLSMLEIKGRCRRLAAAVYGRI